MEIASEMVHPEMFLFQIGAIKTLLFSFFLPFPLAFLFQIGAIKTSETISSLDAERSSFYSRLVRLKPIKAALEQVFSPFVSIPDWCD